MRKGRAPQGSNGMHKLVVAMRTSEFWVGLTAIVLQFLVAQGVIDPAVSNFIYGAVTYVFGRVVSKVVKSIPGA